jgi:D-3-phosphoglycerate dehydrogenase
MKKILVADPLSPEAFGELKSIPGFEVTLKTGMDEAELIKIIPDFHATVVRGATKVTKNAIEAASNMELIVRAGIGLDNIDVAAAEEKGIQVTNTPAATSISVAEHAFGLMLAAVRNHGRANLSMKEHKWEKKILSGTELYGKTLGIIGIGRIGQEVAKRALAFGMKVIAYDVIDVKIDLDVKQVGLEELIQKIQNI